MATATATGSAQASTLFMRFSLGSSSERDPGRALRRLNDRNVVFRLRYQLFTKLSQLPIAFFAQNRAGDLI